MVLVPGNLLGGNLVLGSGPEAVEKPLPGGRPSQCVLAQRKRVKITLIPQLDQGNEEVIRVALLTFDLKR